SLPYVARFKSSFFGSNVELDRRVDRAHWTALGISPQEQWAFRDDTAEYGFTLSADYFHKYLVTENGETHETDWQKVDETPFENHVDELTMHIVDKPLGKFQQENITNTTPPGNAFRA